ncbi:MAG: hypothetical protein KF857_01240 [Fimbriimonadaceae bacterium]|nr:hypothetical protein [Fimbriimonadaceae bacterium]
MARVKAFVLGSAVLLVFGAVVFATKFAPKPTAPKAPAGPQAVSLPKGTKVELLLLTALDSGGSAEGTDVELVLARPLKVKGEVLVPAGTKATGKVTRSRGASVFSAFSNQPARLAIEVTGLKAPDGTAVKLSASDDGTYELTQANTAGRRDAAKVDRLWQTPEGQQVLKDLVAQSTGTAPSGPVDLKRLSDVLGLHDTREVADRLEAKGDKPQAQDTVAGLLHGDLSKLTGVDLVLATKALGEIQSVVGSVDDKLRGVFKGSNIHATAGTPVPARVKESVRLFPVPASPSAP